ncbi:choline phosphate cytidylyltransferase [Exophiala dermatitidis]|uniref:ethanolamine-phosphate cytidylyltransferase n=2 Tax=Exophiala dermatitidis TaxID=5970 RepID=H6BW09_EXODN|nr:ethanolamine-phosphate cytidylyltransferase [Exophiala dermatitidis NIH/UT8656]KAJ4511387.1 choline phosphate cytidylyltransferase [Exophiala dermatitidis]EHY55980.1 ethanolamine-phosphate cytidylyltransferase [Exophiala dermatitidis NIH/UT8656]KAJ4514139.1 choline phosphate cytidylyltransferase [Exophiala dermatitidis]KAJ4515377.1 choline phosphate cytidylyltransferase [Exophiala dermatitidis]KAJ4533787.1 choline phosphate cytidylyltransferase [Exophiala dermatitidis]
MEVPKPGQWPVDPQEDQEIRKDRIWVDGCFDFAHHGHAGALRQARQLGNELYVGLHSDEEILRNKGPTVMTLDERVAAVDACRWTTKSIPHAPYVTALPWISHYGCYYVVHGDDITSDADGEDCYRFVKAAGRFLVVKRTPGISTTDLVGRMLLCTKTHFIRSLVEELQGKTDTTETPEKVAARAEMLQRIKEFAMDETARNPGSEVWTWTGKETANPADQATEAGSYHQLVAGNGPKPGQRIVYVDGGFDLFSSGHIEFLKRVNQAEKGEAYVVAGVHNDEVINHWKGLNYPIMNIFERGLCVLQCRYVHAVVFGAPYSPSKAYLDAMPLGRISAVYHGPTDFMGSPFDPYKDVRELGILREIPNHPYSHVNAGEIVMRIMKGRQAFEERQRRKGEKAVGEEAARQRELLEQQQAAEETKRRKAAS